MNKQICFLNQVFTIGPMDYYDSYALYNDNDDFFDNPLVHRFLADGPWISWGFVDGNSGVHGVTVSFFLK